MGGDKFIPSSNFCSRQTWIWIIDSNGISSSKPPKYICREIKPTLIAYLAKVMSRKSDKNIRKIKVHNKNSEFKNIS